MSNDKEKRNADALGKGPRAFSLWTVALSVAVLLAAAGTGALTAWAGRYEGKVAPNVFIGSLSVGGLAPDQARTLVQKRVDELVTQGVSVEHAGEKKPLPLSTLVSSDLIEHVSFDIAAAVEEAARARKGGSRLATGAGMLLGLKERKVIPVPVELDETHVRDALHRLFPDAQEPIVDARLDFAFSAGAWQAETVPGKTGTEFDTDTLVTDLQERLSRLQNGTFALEAVAREPGVTEADAERARDAALALLGKAPYALTFEDAYGRVSRWSVGATDLADMLLPSANPDLPVAIDPEPFDAFLDTVAEAIERPARNARFEIRDGRVVEFEESEPGVAIDRERAREEFLALLAAGEETEVAVAIEETEPEVATGEANDLGVTEILGTGTSSYRGSPPNRIRNIRNGVRLLNGLLITPDTTFSLTGALRPFTFENGYLPELVIKGDKIKPELGGGLCQIGTTTFRATMNSGLPVAERRNHSLVVSYYNDPSNGNPGTDATLYEPAPDFKFTNDTDDYILFQAEMLEATQELRFTFWGTSDGRRGSYTPPVVHRWIPVGETRYIETDDLEPGVEKCQEAHIGADASFTYTVVHPDGTEDERVFSSHYRPLPRICLVGTEPEPEEEDGSAFSEFPEGMGGEPSSE